MLQSSKNKQAKGDYLKLVIVDNNTDSGRIDDFSDEIGDGNTFWDFGKKARGLTMKYSS